MHCLAEVALVSPPYATLSYELPSYLPTTTWAVGMRVAVPLGKSIRCGVIIAFKPPEQQTKDFIIKPLLWPLEATPLLQDWYLDLANQMAVRQSVTRGHILSNILPAGLRTAQLSLRFLSGGTPEAIKIPKLATLNQPELVHKGELWQQGLGFFCKERSESKENELYCLLKDAPWPIRPSAKAQLALLEYLLEHGSVSRKRLLKEFGKRSLHTLSLLVERGIVGIKPAIDADIPLQRDTSKSATQGNAFTLSKEQQTVFDNLVIALTAESASTHLLFGVTGSGKTAIYLELARKTLALGKSVLLLAPEVALAYKLYNDVSQAFSDPPLSLFHGYLTGTAKEKIFKACAENTAPMLCVGTRSALFLPIENIGLIVLDEEHDSSFKQDERFTYQAKEIAWYRAGKEKALLLLGSATPDLKTYHAALHNKIPLHTIDVRVGHGELPEVELVLLPKSNADKSLLVEKTAQALHDVIKAGEQAIILHNRRGYAPLMYCLACETVVKCPHCDIGLTYHKGRERLICHYCGYAVHFPSPCQSCHSMNFLPMGEGTEKLEESLPSILPTGTKILRLDRDSTRRPGRMEEILTAFAKKEASVLVGTQMLSKGHHFPDVTLAIIADADLGLNLPDYRAAERTFQLLVQSSGRSGRGDKKGKVIIQTRDPSHYCWNFVKNADYIGFFKHEIALREKRRYPPFINLAMIKMSYPVSFEKKGEAEVKQISTILREKGKELGLTILGPAPAPLPFLNGRKRVQCLIKSSDWQSIRRLYSLVQNFSSRSDLRISLDLDPVNML